MTRIRLGAEHKALAVLTSLAAGAAVVYGCIPSPDTSGLPPYDAGPPSIFDANIVTSFEGGDANIVTTEDAGGDEAGEDAGPGTGTVTGVVTDFAQGEGVGLVPLATVSILNGPSTTTDIYGTFTLKNVPAGAVSINVGKATDTTNNIAYSTTQSIVSVVAGQTTTVFPVIHEGCIETVNLATVSGTPAPITLSDGKILCPFGEELSTAYAALSYQVTSFTDPAVSGGSAFNGTIRVEIIPVAFPQTAGGSPITDYSWTLGLPGAATPVETLGAVQIRVLDNGTGDPLAVRTGDSVGVTMQATRAFTAGENVALYSYDSTTSGWAAVAGANAPVAGTVTSLAVGTTTTVPTLGGSWLILTKPAQPTSCITGTLTIGTTSPAANVLVRGYGRNYMGASTAVTDSTGAFCMNVAAAPSDGGAGPSVQLAAGLLSSSGTVLVADPAGPTTVTTQSGSCATKTSCTAIAASIPTVPVNGGCFAGSVTGTGVPPSLDVDLTGLSVSSTQASAGIRTIAYVGSVTPGSDGTFCAPVFPGFDAQLAQPAVNPNGACRATLGQATTGGTPISCGTGGCIDAGAVNYICP